MACSFVCHEEHKLDIIVLVHLKKRKETPHHHPTPGRLSIFSATNMLSWYSWSHYESWWWKHFNHSKPKIFILSTPTSSASYLEVLTCFLSSSDGRFQIDSHPGQWITLLHLRYHRTLLVRLRARKNGKKKTILNWRLIYTEIIFLLKYI